MRKYSKKTLSSTCYERTLLNNTNPQLLENVLKCFKWIEDNCPNLNGIYNCRHNPYYWMRLVVENGKAYLENGSHGYSFSMALSSTETAVMSTGSMQSIPYSYDELFFRNDKMEEFLSQWHGIKNIIIADNERKNRIYSNSFQA